MHLRTVFHIQAVLLLILGVVLGVPTLLALADGTQDRLALGLSMVVALAVGGALYLATRSGREGRRLTQRDGYLATALGWLFASIAGALPFFLFAQLLPVDPQWVPEAPAGAAVCDLPVEALHPGREFCNPADAMFESISGFTTTGASVIRVGLWDATDSPTSFGKPALPRGLLLWRSLIHWLGGMGILVLAVTVLALVGVGGVHLMRAEVPGPSKDRLSPHIADTARMLWWVYAGMSVAQVLALTAGGMDLFNAACHTCATMATGGFSTLTASAGSLTPYAQWVIILFMFLAGANFTLHWTLVFKRSLAHLHDSEFRAYTVIVLCSTAVLAAVLVSLNLGWGALETVRHAAFQVVSIMTTTGFMTADFALWAPGAQLLLVVLMFIGGCAGSTGGGIKVVRLQVTLKAAVRELLRVAQPRVVPTIRTGHQVIKDEKVFAILGVVALFVGTFVLSSLALALMGLDIVTATSAVAACIGNVGPGLGAVGPAVNYHSVPEAGKWVLMFNMIAGRLEIYTILVLFSPSFWRR